jgi:hypothetical protein
MPRISPALVLIVAVALLAGCGDDAAPGPAAPTGLISGSAAPDVSASADDPPGALTCARLAAAIERSTLMEPGVVAEIDRAAGTADAPVADAARRLAAAYSAAVNASGAPEEPDRIAAVSAAASDMSGVCRDSGLETVG